MAKLTAGDWLESYKLVGFERHEEIPFLNVPAQWEYRAHSICQTCPKVGEPGHISYECGKMLAPAPVESTFNLWAPVTLQYLISRISGDIYYPYGAVPGFAYYGWASINFAQRFTYRVTGVAGNVLTCESDGDFGAVAIATQMRGNWGALGRSFLTAYGYGIQPNDRVEPGGGSIAYGKLFGRVAKVHYTRPGLCLVTVDQDFSAVMEDNREDQTEAWIPTVTFIRQAAELENWTPVVWPSELKCHRNFVSFLPADFPEDYLFNLKRLDGTEGRIAEPDPVEGKPPTFTVWKKQVNPEPTPEVPEPEPSPIEDITNSCLGRVKMVPTGPGPDFRGAYKTILCLGEKNWNGAVSFSPLIDENTEWVKILYYAEVSDGYNGTTHCVPCGRRCVHSVRDLSGSFYDADEGEAHLPNGEEWFCRIARTYTDEEDDSPENFGKWKRVWHKPSGVHLYTADCSLRGLCDSYTNISRSNAIGDKPTTLDGGDMNHILKELTIGQDIALAQYWPGYPIFYVRRAGRPTIHSLTTGVPASNPTEWAPTIQWVQTGGYLVGNFDTGPHPTEPGEILNPLYGGAWDARTLWSTLTFPAMPPGGIFPTNIPGWAADKMDALRRPYDDSTDPYKALRYYEEDCGVRTGRLIEDANAFGRGVSQAVRKVGAAEFFLLEKLDVGADAKATDQVRKETVFKFFDSEQIGPYGFPYWFTVTFKNLLPEGGEPKGIIKEAKIMHVTTAGDEVTFHLENQSLEFSKLKNVGMGNSFNEIYTLKAGGGIVRPPDPLQLRSSETDNNSFGGVQDWASIGDSVTIEHNAPGFADFNKLHTCIVKTKAYGGNKAADFGSGQRILLSDLSGGYYQIPETQLDLGNGTRGRAIAGEAVTAEDYVATDTTFTLVGTPPFRYDQWLKVETTNEIIRVTSVDPTNRIIYVNRGLHGTTAQPIPAGKKLTLIKVFNPATHTILMEKTGETKPSLDANEYWYDEQAARFYWAPNNTGDYLDIGFYVDDGTGIITQSRAYFEASHRAFYSVIDGVEFTLPYFITNVEDVIKWVGTGDAANPETKVYLEGSEVNVTTSNPPPADKYAIYENASVNGGNLIIFFARENAGKGVRIGVANEPGQTNPFNMDIADVPEFATGQAWGRNMDTITIKDERGWVAAQASSLIGKTLKVHRHEMVFSPDTELTSFKYMLWQEGDYTEAALSDLMLVNGLATLYGKKAPLESMQELYPPDPEPTEEVPEPKPLNRFVCVEIR